MTIFAVLMVALTACAPYRLGDSEAELALEDLMAGAGDSRLKDMTSSPVRTSVYFMTGGIPREANLYVPSPRAKAAILLVPGVAPEGKEDPRLVRLAATLARTGFAVMVPEMPGLRQNRVRARDVREVADAFAFLQRRADLAPEGRAGIAGISYAAGPAVLAALKPDIRNRVHFVISVGGYYSLTNLVTYLTTGYYRAAGIEEDPGTSIWKRLSPLPYGKWVFTLSNADLVERPSDRAFLRAYAEEAIRDFEMPMPPSPNRLAADAQAVFELVSNEIPTRVPALIDRLSPRVRDELEGINPEAQDLSLMRARVLLLHGRSDNLIPFTESLALARALPKDRVRLFVIDGLVHVDLKPKRRDVPDLIEAMRYLLSFRDSGAEKTIEPPRRQGRQGNLVNEN